MADGERTTEEREAARLERERRRVERTGRAPVDVEQSEAEPEPELESQPELEPARTRARRARRPEPELDGHYGTDEHELELPSGTRRVSRLETPGAPRDKKRPVRRRRKPARATSPRRKWLVRAGALTALVLAAAVIWFLVELFQPFAGSAHGHVTVEIPPHASSSQIGDILANDGVIPSSLFFELRATLDGERGDLRSGIYHLQQGMTLQRGTDGADEGATGGQGDADHDHRGPDASLGRRAAACPGRPRQLSRRNSHTRR